MRIWILFLAMVSCASIAHDEVPLIDALEGATGKPSYVYGCGPEIHVMYQWATWGGAYFDREHRDYTALPPLEFIAGHGYTDDSGEFHPAGYFDLAGIPRWYTGLVVINIESWATSRHADYRPLELGFEFIPSQEMIETKDKILQTLAAVRHAVPFAKVGWYGFRLSGYPVSSFPFRSAETLAAWRTINDWYSDIFAQLDVIVPSLYYTYTLGDRATPLSYESYQEKVGMLFDESVRVGNGKPIVPFISPYVMDAYPETVDLSAWAQFKEDYEGFDGLVMWSKPNPSRPWDEIETHWDIMAPESCLPQ